MPYGTYEFDLVYQYYAADKETNGELITVNSPYKIRFQNNVAIEKMEVTRIITSVGGDYAIDPGYVNF